MSQLNRYTPSYRIVVGGTELSHGATIDVSSVSVTETFNQADTFSLVVRDTHPTPDRLFPGGDELYWLDSDFFNEGNEIEIHMGYVDNVQLMLLGEITAVATVFSSQSPPSLSIQGQSLYHRLNRVRRREPFVTVKDSDVAKKIGEEVGLQVEADDTQNEHALISTNGATLGAILLGRAKRINYEMTVKESTLYFQQPRYIENPGATITLEWGRDIISFNPRLSTHNMPTQVTCRSTQTSLGRGKDPIVGTAKVGDERAKMGDQSGLEIVKASFGEHQLLIEDHEIGSVEEANALALARLESAGMEYISGQGACVGNPDLRSRTVIELKGLGKRFSGNYYVTSTTHLIQSGGYITNFSFKRNGR